MVTIDTLLTHPVLSELKVIAGRDATDKEVRAVSVMDALDSYKWLKGGEFILTSGFLFGSDVELFEFYLMHLIERESSGLGIKKRRFISNVPENVLSLANQHHFPIVEIPYRFGWSDIISAYYELRYEFGENTASPAAADAAEHKHENISLTNQAGRYQAFVQGILSGNIKKEDILDFEESREDQHRIYTGMAVIHSSDTAAVYNLLTYTIKTSRFQDNIRARTYIAENTQKKEALILLELHTEGDHELLTRWQHMVLDEMEDEMHEIGESYMAFGRLYESLEDIMESMYEARDACSIGAVLWGERRTFSYMACSTFITLLRAGPSKVDFSEIESLNSNHTGLFADALETLEAFMECGSYKKAADRLFIHENTMRYRIQKITDFLYLNVEDHTLMHILLTKLKLWRLIQKNRM